MKLSDQRSSNDASAPELKKRKVVYSTYQKRKADLDRDCQTITWLNCDTEVSGKKKIVTRLRCDCVLQIQGDIAKKEKFQ